MRGAEGHGGKEVRPASSRSWRQSSFCGSSISSYSRTERYVAMYPITSSRCTLYLPMSMRVNLPLYQHQHTDTDAQRTQKTHRRVG